VTQADGSSQPRVHPGFVARWPLFVWFIIGCSLVSVVQWGYLAQRDFNPTALLHTGRISPARARLERELGHLYLASAQGHDGKYFYLLARHPWFWKADPEVLEGIQDPGYRYNRPLYPLLAGLGGTLSPRGTLAGMMVVEVLAGGLFAMAIVLLARFNGLPTLAVLLGFATPAIYSSSVLLTSDLLALALCLLGVYHWQRERLGISVLLFAAAILAKEYYALTPLTIAATTIRQRPRAALVVGVVSLLPLAAWKLAVALVVGVGEGRGNFTWPGGGIIATAAHWENLRLGVFAVFVVLLSLTAVCRRSRPLPRWQCLVWGSLGLFTSELVWLDPADVLRVISPAWWFAIWCWWPVSGVVKS
jgi:hypothetical protein